MCCLELHPLKKNGNKGLFTPYRAIRKRYSNDFLCALLLLSIASLKIQKARNRFRVGFSVVFSFSYIVAFYLHIMFWFISPCK